MDKGEVAAAPPCHDLTVVLPEEIIGYIFSFFPTKELYPTLFIINKLCYKAVRHNVVWEQRCKNELMLNDKPAGCVNWIQSYKEAFLPWDSKHFTPPKEGEEIIINANSFQRLGTNDHLFAVRAKHPVKAGHACFDFVIEDVEGCCAVGVVDPAFDCVSLSFGKKEKRPGKFEYGTYWNDGIFWNVRNDGRCVYETAPRWEKGSVVGVRVDLDNHVADYFLNNVWVLRVRLPYNLLKAYPVASMLLTSVVKIKLIWRSRDYYIVT